MPPLHGSTIEEHFHQISTEQVQPYRSLIETLVKIEVPAMPTQWMSTTGWTHYCPKSGCGKAVPHPADDAFVFDIEVCVPEGSAPTMACALGPSGWYSWTSAQLNGDTHGTEKQRYRPDQLIPLEGQGADGRRRRIVVGHNVSYDRARIREQYELADTGTRFLDTMSLHVCCSGVTSYQRAMLKAKRDMPVEDLEWSQQSSLNSLAEVFRLYCGDDGIKMDKTKRNVFVDGTLQEIRDDFAALMHYCATDVLATHAVLKRLYPMFQQRFPHPATLAGMLEIGMAYLPVNGAWPRYIEQSRLTYEDLNIESKYLLSRRALEACRLAHNDRYRRDIWMWDQDWTRQSLTFNKSKSKKRSTTTEQRNSCGELNRLRAKFAALFAQREWLPARRPLLPGYPAWYRKLCAKFDGTTEWVPGPTVIGTGMQVAPKLLSLCWEGYPLHFVKGQGWGFLVPFKDAGGDAVEVPIEKLALKCPTVLETTRATKDESEDAFRELVKTVEVNLSRKDYYRKKTTADPTNGLYRGTGVWCDLELDGCCWFMKLPHKDGAAQRVGNPLARDFLNKFAENVLSGDGHTAERVIKIARMLSYWRNNRERIQGQMVVWQDDDTGLGAIVPQIVVCGTLTRRVMEPTWMTASNATRERVGSELRAIVQAPPGHRFVGADVDSQELWIASVLGDASATGCHGATPFGWMTLSGSKADGTDMHSVTAAAVGISRDHAKVINYARIYGAGQTFAERLLKQFNPTYSEAEAKSKAQKMFALTKGKRLFRLRKDEIECGDFLDKK